MSQFTPIPLEKRFPGLAALAEATTPQPSPLDLKLASKNAPPDHFRTNSSASTARKRRRSEEDGPVPLQPQPKVQVTAGLRAAANARYVTPLHTIGSLVSWLQRVMSGRLAGSWARREAERERAEAQRRARVAEIAAEIRALQAAAQAQAALDSSPLAEEHLSREEERPPVPGAPRRLVEDEIAPQVPPGLVRFPPPGGCDPLPLAEDQVYPEFPNLEAGSGGEEYFMTGGAGPAGTLTYDSEGDEESEEEGDEEMEEGDEEEDEEDQGTEEDEIGAV